MLISSNSASSATGSILTNSISSLCLSSKCDGGDDGDGRSGKSSWGRLLGFLEMESYGTESREAESVAMKQIWVSLKGASTNNAQIPKYKEVGDYKPAINPKNNQKP
ncbi:hypothetical protein L2E82_44791 [Cichorium intybus]|uniref:Uncharacterized protein n=1 Tax=Cichorium intybus TaxID=13427 RepID=A0ACB8ZS29_CICIN|nr:hypothetical protein L2E82_44791 [Cichorium intybus]